MVRADGQILYVVNYIFVVDLGFSYPLTMVHRKIPNT